jgi:hypothetical protein
MTLNDYNLASSTLLDQYKSQGYSDYISALKLALVQIELAILKTNGQWTKSKKREIKKLIEIEIAKSYGGLFQTIADESTQIATVTYAGAMSLIGMEKTINTSVIKDLISSTREIQGNYDIKKNKVSRYEFKDLFQLQEKQAHDLKKIIAGSEAQRKTVQQIVQDIRVASKISAKTLKKNVFTVLADSRSKVIYDSYKEIEKAGLDVYYEHLSVLDQNTSRTCKELDGRKYYLALEEIPPYLRPPIHISCRSQLQQLIKGEDYKGLRSSAFGAVPSDIKYPDWFKTLSDDNQKMFLGKKRYDLYKRGAYKINSLPDVSNAREINLSTFESNINKIAK